MSSSNAPCAACKFLRRKCTQECVFAPYFPPDQPHKFANVHKVFGASNVSKILNELEASQRNDAVSSLAYEAEFRLRDPVYGCVGFISLLQQELKKIESDLYHAKKELASYITPPSPTTTTTNINNNSAIIPGLIPQQYHPTALVHGQPFFEPHPQQQPQQRFVHGFDAVGSGFNLMNNNNNNNIGINIGGGGSNLTLGTNFVDDHNINGGFGYQIHESHNHHHHQQSQQPLDLFVHPQPQQQQQQPLDLFVHDPQSSQVQQLQELQFFQQTQIEQQQQQLMINPQQHPNNNAHDNDHDHDHDYYHHHHGS